MTVGKVVPITRYHNRTSNAELEAASKFLESMAKAIRAALSYDNDPCIIERQHAHDLMVECEMHAKALSLREEQ